MSYAYVSLVSAIIYGAVNLIVARDLSRLVCDTPRLNFGCITAVPRPRRVKFYRVLRW
ncbi:hypothetical protein [uncultured Campylobacter sp.]|uniref:hypothetical protein n=1 Tax=uncultured Campylobacter sp. TaxID=218934 RepID=UPI00261479FB|nr:hypothetical protein [uncultured Campylobacter sp.]